MLPAATGANGPDVLVNARPLLLSATEGVLESTPFRSVFRKHGVSPTCFELEITETTLMADSKRTLHLLEPRYSTGDPIQADSIRELAELLGIPARKLEQTVETYNAAVREGEFDPFRLDGLATDEALNPPKSNWARPLDRPPFRAWPVIASCVLTYGGLKVDTHARVLDTEGEPLEVTAVVAGPPASAAARLST